MARATPPKRTSAARRASSGDMPQAKIVLDGGVEVGGDLGVEVAIERLAAKDGEDAVPGAAKRHRS